MAFPQIRDRLGEGGFLVSAWLTLTDPIVHEAFLRADFDMVTFDVQHGLHDTASVRAGIERAVWFGKPALVRLPIEDRALAARVLDFGASGVMMPMIETADEARALVAVTKYPPLGQRSFGPTRASELYVYPDRTAYVADARNETLALAMIETRASVDNLDEILAVDGLDGVFVGPSDLSIALSGDGTLDPRGELAEMAIKRIGSAASAAGKIATIYAGTPEDARRYRGYGYRLVCVGSDLGVVVAGARALADGVRG